MELEPTYEQLLAKLSELENTLKAIRNGEVDAVIGSSDILFLRIREVEEELKRERERLERSVHDRDELLEELKAHQAELEIQTEELRQSHEETQQARNRYFDLYNYAPVGYLTMEVKGSIVEANLTVADMLGLTRDKLLGSPLTAFVSPDSQDDFFRHKKSVLENGSHTAEIMLRRKDGSSLLVQLDSRLADRDTNPNIVRTSLTDITRSKQAEDKLRESYHDLNRAQEVAQTGSWRLDIQHNELLWSQENYRIFGVPKQTPMTYETFLYRVHPDDRDYVDSKWQAALQGEDYDIEHRIIVGDEVRWVRERAELEFDSEGMLRGGFGTTQDITDQKKTSEALLRAHQRLELAYEAAGAGAWDWDIISGHIEWSAKMFELIGLDPKEATASFEAWENVIHLKDRESATSCIYEALEEHNVLINEHRIVLPDGRIRWINAQGKGIYNDQGKPVRMIGICTDVTERKMVEEALRKAEEQAKALVKHAPAAIYEVDFRVPRFLSVNDVMCDYLGYTREELLTMNPIDILDDESKEVFQKRIAKQSAGENVEEAVEYKIKARDGREHYAILNVTFTYDNGELKGALVVAHDVTERKRIGEIKDQFIGLVSHELKSPLTVVIGALRTALDENIPPEEARELLGDAIWGAESLDSILNNLLELSRYQASRLNLDKKETDIREIAEMTVRSIANLYPEHTIELDISSQLPAVNIDTVRIGRVMANLIDNACKYSPGGSKVKVFARRNDEGILVSISDQGPGIPLEYHESLFEPFNRLGNEKNTKGIGLGLVVCKHLVEAHNGRIWVESKPGEGSTFGFNIPLSKEI